MLGSYIKTAGRSALRQRGYSLVNIIGLAISMAVVIPILLWIFVQFDYDRFNANLDRIVMLSMEQRLDTGSKFIPGQPAPMARRLENNIPEVERSVRTIESGGTLTYNDKSIDETIIFADPALLTVFSFPLTRGDSVSALSDPHSVVLSNETAIRLFGDTDPIGKTIELNRKVSLTVSGILHETPSTSSLKPNVLVPLQHVRIYGKKDLTEWGGSDYTTWLLLKPGFNPDAVRSKVATFCSEVYREIGWYEGQRIEFFLTPLGKLHLYGSGGVGGLINTILVLGMIALGILLMACFNYSNLVTARAAIRSQEIGVRKAIGATRGQILTQLFTETALINVVSLFLAIGIVELAFPFFSNLLNTNLEFKLLQPAVLAVLLGVTILSMALSGLYPALVSSKMKPISGLNRRFLVGKSARYLRWFGVVFQVALSGVLLSFSSGVYKQMDFILHVDLGVDISNVIQINETPAIKEHFESLRDELLRDPAIYSVSASQWSVFDNRTVIGPSWTFDGRDESKTLEVHLDRVTADYANTFGIKMTQGRFFSPEHPSDKENGVVLNQTAVDLMGMENPVGKRFGFWGYEMKVIGVMEDFHLEPLSKAINPLVLINRTTPSRIYVKIAAQNQQRTLSRIESALHSIDPTSKPNYGFLEDQYSRMYAKVGQLQDLMSISSLLAVVIACLGIFGLVSFVAEKRHREIGIRKVLGASVIRVSGNVISEIFTLAFIGIFLSFPVSVVLINRWLESYAYHSGNSIETYFQTLGVVILVVSISTVYPVLKAATSNPVDALRSE